jgi:hypothetical protein
MRFCRLRRWEHAFYRTYDPELICQVCVNGRSNSLLLFVAQIQGILSFRIAQRRVGVKVLRRDLVGHAYRTAIASLKFKLESSQNTNFSSDDAKKGSLRGRLRNYYCFKLRLVDICGASHRKFTAPQNLRLKRRRGEPIAVTVGILKNGNEDVFLVFHRTIAGTKMMLRRLLVRPDWRP